MTDSSVTIESLLVHAGWLRELSRRLVGEAGAEDLVQEVWLQATVSPPREEGSPRAWLATVLRRSHGKRVARDRAAKVREADVARAEALPSAAELAGRAEAQRWLVEAVLALDDPWRETLLLHFFEGSSAAEIARRDGVPTSTVRTRVARGIELLRERLDARPGGRESWLSGLALLAFAPRRASAAGLFASASVPLLSVVMWKVATAAISIVFVAWLASAVFDGGPARPLEPGAPEPDAVQALATTPPASEPTPAAPVERASVAPEATADPLPEVAAASRTANAIVGRVLDPWGKPIDGARVRNGTFHEIYLRQNSDRGGTGLMVESDANGRFHLTVPAELRSEEPSLLISAHHDEYAASEQVEVATADLASGPELELRLRVGASLRGTVYGIDEEPVEGRGVTLAAPELNAFRRLTTDANGRFETQGLIPAAWRAATFPDEAELAAAGVGTDAQTQVSYLAQREFQLEAGESLEIDLGRPSP
ncbi:MAG: sigma-70 family RNA polymerase sigma factor, partial [Planctomycetota bacterium]